MRQRLQARVFATRFLAVGALGWLAAALALGARASPPTVDFDIPAGDLADSLDKFGEQSGLQVVYDFALVAERRTAAIVGVMPPREALDRFLEGSGLKWTFVNDGTVVVRRAATERVLPRRPARPATGQRRRKRVGRAHGRRQLPRRASEQADNGVGFRQIRSRDAALRLPHERRDDRSVRPVRGRGSRARRARRLHDDALRHSRLDRRAQRPCRYLLPRHEAAEPAGPRPQRARGDGHDRGRERPAVADLRHGQDRRLHQHGAEIRRARERRLSRRNRKGSRRRSRARTIAARCRSASAARCRLDERRAATTSTASLEDSDTFTEGVPVGQRLLQAPSSIDDLIGDFRLEAGRELPALAYGRCADRTLHAGCRRHRAATSAARRSSNLDANGNGAIGYLEMHAGSPVRGNDQRRESAAAPALRLADGRRWHAVCRSISFPTVPGIPQAMYDYLARAS